MMGKFITFEGCEGVGKSTQLTLLKKYLEEEGIDAIFTREPGGTAISEKIREIILDIGNKRMSPYTEALLYSAARVQHVEEVIEPALKEGKLVICDRYIDSSYAYQGYARGLGIELIRSFNQIALNKCKPDLTIFLDLDPESSFLRKGGRDISDRLENEKIDFHKKVYDGYIEAMKLFPERIKSIKSNGSKFQTNIDIINLLKERNIIK